MIPLRSSLGIGPHETLMEERVLETTLTLVGGLVGTGSKEKLASRMDQPKQNLAGFKNRAKHWKNREIEITIDYLVKLNKIFTSRI